MTRNIQISPAAPSTARFVVSERPNTGWHVSVHADDENEGQRIAEAVRKAILGIDETEGIRT